MKQQFLVDVADTIRLTIYEDNRPVVPSSAAITLYKSDGSVLQASAVATVDATTGEMTYDLTTTHNDIADLDYKATWAYVVSGVTYYQNQLYDVVKSILSIPITDEDLYNELESLRKANYQATDTATAGATGTITDTKRREENNFWKGGTIEIVAGTGIGQKRDITAFVQSTGVFSITPNWATSPDNTSVYIIVKSFTKKIQAAFETLCTMIYNKGKRHWLILESSQIAVPLTFLTIHMIALDLMDEPDDKWSRISSTYLDKFKDFFGNMKLEYDEDEDAKIDSSEQGQGPTELRIGRA